MDRPWKKNSAIFCRRNYQIDTELELPGIVKIDKNVKIDFWFKFIKPDSLSWPLFLFDHMAE